MEISDLRFAICDLRCSTPGPLALSVIGRMLLVIGCATVALATVAGAVPTVRILTTSGEDAAAFGRGDTLVVEVVDASAAAESVAVTGVNVVRLDTLALWAQSSSDTSFEGPFVPSWGTQETADLDVFPGDTISCRYVGVGGSAADSARALTHTAVLEIGALGGLPGDPVSVLDSLVIVIHDRDLWLEDSVVVDVATSVERDSLWLKAVGDEGDFWRNVGLVWGTGTAESALEVQGVDRVVACYTDAQDAAGIVALVCDSVSVRTWSARAFWEDSLGNPVADYAPAATDSLRLRIEDRDVAGAAWVEGEVVNLSDPVETEHVVLVPAAMPDSIFRRSLAVQQPPVSPGNGIVEASAGDTLEFRYVEEADSAGTSAEVLVCVHYGGTAVAGTQAGTWTADDAPFLLYGDVTVPAGQTLTIEEGVAVKALPNQDITGSGLHETKVELVVHGALVAEGTLSDSVIMTSSSPSGGHGLWGGVRAEQGASLRLAYARLSGAAVGVAALAADVNLRSVTLAQNGLESSRALQRQTPPVPHRVAVALPDSLGAETACALYLEDCAGDTIENCVIGPTEGYGVLSFGSSPVFGECSFRASTLDGAVFLQSGGVMDRCRIGQNGQDGLYLLESAMVVTGCLVSENGWAGVDAAFGSDTVLCSGFVGNELRGVLLYMENGALMRGNSLMNNLVGVAVHGEQSPADLRWNGLLNNEEAGVHVAYGASPRVCGSNLYANGAYDLEMGDYAWADVWADSNWWGTATTAAMQAGEDSIDAIWDWWDDRALGEVLFWPWLLGQEVRGPHEPDSAEIVELSLSPGTGDTILIVVGVQASSLDPGLLDYCTVEVWSDDDSVGIVVALPERDPVTGLISPSGSWFRGWLIVDSVASSDPLDELHVSPGSAVYAQTTVNATATDTMTWMSADPPGALIPTVANLRVFPNPCSGTGAVVLSGVVAGAHEVGVYDVRGRLVGHVIVSTDATGEGFARWWIPQRFASGVYVLRSSRAGPSCKLLLCR